MRKILILILLFGISLSLFSQVKLEPAKPGLSEKITLTFSADQGNEGLKDFQGDVFAHTGVITSSSASSSDWKYVVADWGANKSQLKLKRTSKNTYQLNFTIHDLYEVPEGEEVYALAFVFRNEDGSEVGKTEGNGDIFYWLKDDVKFKEEKNNPAVLEVSQTPHPQWAENATIYEVNVRQYTKEGTFKAFSEHLPRLKSMGIDILWFMPIHPIGLEKRKGPLGSYYSIQEYKGINPEFGSLEDFENLVNTCHEMGMKVVLDWVANHSAWDHKWVENHPDWYIRNENGEINSPFDWTDVAELDYDMYYMRKEMTEAMVYWVKELDVDGFRCDVAGEVPVDFWNETREELEKVKPVWMIAEDESKLWLLNEAFNANYGWTMHHTMNEIAQGNQNAEDVYKYFENIAAKMPKGTYPMQFITNHDENSWNGTIEERLGEAHQTLAVLSFTIPGMPLIYSGQEAGLDHRLAFFDKDEIDWSDLTLVDFYTSLADLKEDNRALWNGDAGGNIRKIPNSFPESVISFSREKEDNLVMVIMNLTRDQQEVTVNTTYHQGKYMNYLSKEEFDVGKKLSYKLGPWDYKILIRKEKKLRTFVSADEVNDQLQVQTSDGVMYFTPYPNSTMEVEFVSPTHTNPPSYAIAENTTESEADFKQMENSIRYVNGDLAVNITKKPFQIAYSYKGKPLLKEEDGYFNNGSVQGFRFGLNNQEKLMGGGERVLGMDRRGKRLQLYNRASYGYETNADLMYYSLPLVISSDKYMLLFDNGASGYLDLGATEEDILQFEAIGGRMSYVVIPADNWRELTSNYTSITGRQPMVPRWVLGNIASRMGYHTQAEVENVAKEYIRQDFPLDAIVLDVYWFGSELKGHLGNLDWNRDAWPEPVKMMSDLRSKGIKTVLVTEPFVIKGTKTFDEVVSEGLVGKKEDGTPYVYNFYFGTTTLLDVFNQKTKAWFWSIYKKHTDSGVAGWWGDLGEPEVHPDDLIHVNGRADEVHNLYGHEWAKLVYQGYEKDFPNVRPMILMRSGFAGSQRYGLIPWSGDVNRTWGGLKPQVELGLSMSMQGLAYMHSDLGGFAGDNKDAELYTRWLQYGVFQPVYRTHAQEEVPAEPIFWDERTKEIVRKYIRLRYALTPYNYTLTFINKSTGVPMMRPLVYIEDNPDLLENTSEYLWGDAFLISPVVSRKISKKEVYLPGTSTWIDFWSEKAFKGGQTYTVDVKIDNIPVFVKAGSFIPMVPVFQSLDNYTSQKLSLHYYHDASVETSDGMMYEDDGELKDAFEKNKYEQLLFTSEFSKGYLSIELETSGYSYAGKPEKRSVDLIIHGVNEMPRSVSVEKTKYKPEAVQEDMTNRVSGAFYDAGRKVLIVKLELKDKKKIKITEG